MRVLHTADLHIGAAQGEFRISRFVVFRRILSLAKDLNIDILLISGDFLEQEKITASEVEEVKNLLGNLNIPVFISPGNHDPHIPTSSYRGNWPDNVYIFKNPETIVLDELKTSISSVGFTNIYERESLFSEAEHSLRDKNVDPSFTKIAMFHGEMGNPKSLYNPLSKEDLAQSEFNYLALGHIHKPDVQLQKAGRSLYAQAGCPEPLDHGDVGTRGVWYLEFDSTEIVRSQYIQVAENIYLDAQLECKAINNNEDLINKITETLEETEAEHEKALEEDNILPEKVNYQDLRPQYHWNILIKGTRDNTYDIDINYLSKILQSQGIKIAELKDETQISWNEQDLAKEESLRGYFYKAAKSKVEDENLSPDEKELSELALEIGLRSFRGE